MPECKVNKSVLWSVGALYTSTADLKIIPSLFKKEFFKEEYEIKKSIRETKSKKFWINFEKLKLKNWLMIFKIISIQMLNKQKICQLKVVKYE